MLHLSGAIKVIMIIIYCWLLKLIVRYIENLANGILNERLAVKFHIYVFIPFIRWDKTIDHYHIGILAICLIRRRLILFLMIANKEYLIIENIANSTSFYSLGLQNVTLLPRWIEKSITVYPFKVITIIRVQLLIINVHSQSFSLLGFKIKVGLYTIFGHFDD